MRCDEAEEQLNAHGDGELSPADAIALEAHLGECAQCRVLAESFRVYDADLRQAFKPQRRMADQLAERTIAAIRSESAAAPTPVPVVASSGLAWRQILVGLAAGFWLAVMSKNMKAGNANPKMMG